MVMAGTGNVDCLKHFRSFTFIPDNRKHSKSLYGFQMAMHMAIGLLFLGGGQYTLDNTPTAVAALLCSIFPRFPAFTTDHRYHLQPLRHLYCLAGTYCFYESVWVDADHIYLVL